MTANALSEKKNSILEINDLCFAYPEEKKRALNHVSLHVEDGELTPVFLHKTEKKATFYGKPFHDRQFSMVYTLMRDVPAESVVFQKEEISAVKWFSYDEIMRAIDENLPGYCLNKEKFERVYESLKEKLKRE